MKKGTVKRTNLFLIELIIAILFFTLASAICIKLFSNAFVKSNETAALNMALSKATSAAEGILGTDGSMESLLQLFPTGEKQDSALLVFYDKDWQATKASTAIYRMDISLLQADGLNTGAITVGEIDSTAPLYTLTVDNYLPVTLSDKEGYHEP